MSEIADGGVRRLRWMPQEDSAGANGIANRLCAVHKRRGLWDLIMPPQLLTLKSRLYCMIWFPVRSTVSGYVRPMTGAFLCLQKPLRAGPLLALAPTTQDKPVLLINGFYPGVGTPAVIKRARFQRFCVHLSGMRARRMDWNLAFPVSNTTL